ncbi:MAG: hypothetical protein Q9209_001964 [Squamulea sp. 1 TL-2023]
MPFRLLDLPLELQSIVYREIVAPITADEPLIGLTFSEFYSRPEKQAFLTSDAATFLRTSKYINTQASQILWDKRVCEISLAQDFSIFQKTRIITDWRSIGLPPVEFMPKLRNIKICLRHCLFSLRSEDYYFDQFLDENFALLCNELATRCHSLRNIVIDYPCLCRLRNSWVNPITGVEEEHSDCLEPEPFVTFFKPIKRLRVINSIALRCSCRAMDRIQPVFDDLTAICRSSELVEPLSDCYKAWFDLKQKDRSELKDLMRFERELSEAWLWLEHGFGSAQDIPFEESEPLKRLFWTHMERADTVRKGGNIAHL